MQIVVYYQHQMNKDTAQVSCSPNKKLFGGLSIMKKENIKKIVLAYSGGLDTSIIIPWLKENYNNPEIIAVSGNVGQADELEGLEEKAIKTGASKLYVEDVTKEMLEECVFPCVQAGAKYEEYLLGTAFARPFIAKRLVKITYFILYFLQRKPFTICPIPYAKKKKVGGIPASALVT